MASLKTRTKWAKDKREVGDFVALPYMVLRSEEFAALSAIAVKLLMDLFAQYGGDNNGDLTLTWSVMAKRGWRSRDTLFRAQRELLESRFIALTKQGGMHSPSLYGVTMFALDPSSKLEVSVHSFPRGDWKRRQNIEVIRELPNTPVVTIGGGINTPVVSIDPASNAIDPPVVSVKGVLMDESTRRSCTSIDLPSVVLSKTRGARTETEKRP